MEWSVVVVSGFESKPTFLIEKLKCLFLRKNSGSSPETNQTCSCNARCASKTYVIRCSSNAQLLIYIQLLLKCLLILQSEFLQFYSANCMIYRAHRSILKGELGETLVEKLLFGGGRGVFLQTLHCLNLDIV